MSENKMINTMTRQEACEYLSVGLSTLDKLLKRKEHPIPHINFGRRVVLDRARLDKWISEEFDMKDGGVSND